MTKVKSNPNTFYMIRANQQHNLYISFTNHKNINNDNEIVDIAQGFREFGIYFSTKEEAKKFLDTYFVERKVWESNKKYYKILPITIIKPENINGEFTFFNVTCRYEKNQYNIWKNHSKDFDFYYNQL